MCRGRLPREMVERMVDGVEPLTASNDVDMVQMYNGTIVYRFNPLCKYCYTFYPFFFRSFPDSNDRWQTSR
jgi:hypothetical protein